MKRRLSLPEQSSRQFHKQMRSAVVLSSILIGIGCVPLSQVWAQTQNEVQSSPAVNSTFAPQASPTPLAPQDGLLSEMPFYIGASNSTTTHPVKVLIVGGSMARGWHDNPGEGGYLIRALRTFAALNHTQYEVYDHAFPGAHVADVAVQYSTWLQSIRPDITILSWGMLNDSHASTPVSRVHADIASEITDALAIHSVVFMVTPPVSEASYTVYRRVQPRLIRNELRLSANFDSPNVYVFDVFYQMKAYLEAHHQSFQPYMADAWHPNAAGHELAGRILATDLASTFRIKPVDFISQHGLTHSRS